jgi:hypothetical protein
MRSWHRSEPLSPLPKHGSASVWPGLIISVYLGSCAEVRTLAIDDDQYASTNRAERLLETPPTLTSTTRFDHGRLLVTVGTSSACEVTKTMRVHRRRLSERTVESQWPSTVLYIGTGLLGAGIWTYADARNLSAESAKGKTGSTTTTTPQTFQTTGLSLGLIGAALAGVAVGNLARGIDTTTDLGIVDAEATQETIACQVQPARGVVVEVTTPVGHRFSGVTNENGEASLELEAMLAREDFAAHVKWGVRATEGTKATALASVDEESLARIRKAVAARLLASATRLLGEGKLSESEAALTEANQLGATSAEVRANLNAAKSQENARREAEEREARRPKIRQLLATAERLARHGRDLERLEVTFTEIDQLGGKRDEILSVDVEALQDQITELRAETTRSRWKSLIRRCRKVTSAKASLERLSSCDVECRRITEKVDADWERLREEATDLTSPAPEDSEDLRSSCERAGCPECPQ